MKIFKMEALRFFLNKIRACQFQRKIFRFDQHQGHKDHNAFT